MNALPDLHLETLFLFDAAGRILSTREPQPQPGPLFHLIRSADGCAWAVRYDVPSATAAELDRLAQEEPPLRDLQDVPVLAGEYQSIITGQVHSGPAFTFPQSIPHPTGVVTIEDEQLLEGHFRGWVPGEIHAGRAPMMAILEQGFPVSVCFCSRRTGVAAEAGVETAPGFRGRGFASRVTAAWTLAVRASGRIPMYSTDWSNAASLALARKLGLEAYAVDWSITD